MPILFLFLSLLISAELSANNISVSGGKLTTQNATSNTVRIEFNVSWENSFRINTGPANWDAAWVFVKYRVAAVSGGDGIWRHVNLGTTGHTAPSGATIKATPEGALVFRSLNGSGTFTVNGAVLTWNYGTHLENGTQDFIDDDDAIEIKIFAVEMVYVPGGSFTIGDGNVSNSFAATTISSANASATGTGYPTGGSNNNSGYPNGFNAFYCMKYEISQQQYVDFLNTLTQLQQYVRTSVELTFPAGSAVMYDDMVTLYKGPNLNRNGIDIQVPAAGNNPAIFACNLNGDNVFGGPDDGQWLACNYLFFTDWLAYLDWSGLRPMSELEYEKACRGPQPAVLNEFAWGSTALQKADAISNPGAIDETAGNIGSNVCLKSTSAINGPLRVGAFANSTSSRALAGATFYGIMEMTGNTGDPVVYAGINPAFTSVHGNGILKTNGDADVLTWPLPTVTGPKRGISYRGGSWNSEGYGVSFRTVDIDVFYESRSANDGGRGVRTAP